MKFKALLGVEIGIMLFAGCNHPKGEDKLFTLIPSEHSKITFTNQLEEKSDFNIIEYMYYYNGGGVAVGDVNNDGLKDLYFTANLLPNKLYLNRGNFVFEDITKSAGVEGIEGWTCGVTMADINGDGYVDIYVSQLGDYKEITGVNQLYINNGDLTFSQKAKEYGLALVGFSTQASFFDYDNDGDLDMYQLNHAIHTQRSYGRSSLRLEKDTKAGDRLFRNDFDGTEPKFIEVTDQSGIYSSHIGYGLGLAVGDINQDGCLDIYVSNDFHEIDYLYINNCDGTFTERVEKSMSHISRSSMGNDMADFNNDGLLDIVVLDMLPEKEPILKKSGGEDPIEIYNIKLELGYHHQLSRNTLQLNLGNGNFSEIALFSGIHATDWSWASLFCDLDNDGFKDLFITNGILRRPNDLDYVNFYSNLAREVQQMDQPSVDQKLIERMPTEKIENYAFSNNRNLTFTNRTFQWGFDKPVFSNGAAYADLDNDGDLDLIINNINEEAFIYRNNAETLTENNYLRVKLNGASKNTQGIGAKVIIKIKDQILYQEQMPSRGYLSSVDDVLIFGLGTVDEVDSLRVIWGDGKTKVLAGVKANQQITLNQNQAKGVFPYSKSSETLIFQDITDQMNISYRHRENQFIDYKKELLMPHKLSTQGPKIALGDVNNDGLEDFFIGGGKNQISTLFIQNEDGEFLYSAIPSFKEDKLAEDIGAVFLDVDNDQDLDLYVVSGGNEFELYMKPIKDRLYLNDGQGGFSKSTGLLPALYFNGSCVKPEDFDNDGDVDLFVGNRSLVGQYGISPPSFLLENDGTGKYRVVTATRAPQLITAGMVTDALWTDFNGDSFTDLIVVGEWMPIKMLRNDHGIFTDITSSAGLEKTNGWWNAIIQGDFDEDGDMDYVVGNLGMNSKLKASEEEPTSMYIKDFDRNGNLDQILCYYKNGVSTPFATRDELVSQIPPLAKKFPNYQEYSKVATINDIFSPENLKGAHILSSFNFKTSYIENLGNEKFRIRALPKEAQFSPVFGLLADDFDLDGSLDLLLGGNFFGATPNFGRYDAGYGLFLKGDGSGGFDPIDPKVSGWYLKGEIRDIKSIRLTNRQKIILVAKNNDSIQIFDCRPGIFPVQVP